MVDRGGGAPRLPLACCPDCRVVRTGMHAAGIDGMELARRGAAFLYRRGATNVWIFGSVAKGRSLDFRSDIDFAVEGIAPVDILSVGAELEGLLDFPADLIEIEKAREPLRQEIFKHGILVPREN